MNVNQAAMAKYKTDIVKGKCDSQFTIDEWWYAHR